MTKKKKKILAWHFTRGNRLLDGRPVPPVGKVLKHEGELRMCEAGLHASREILDALKYSPGTMLHRVECSGKVVEHNDKLVCSERKILWSVDAEQILFKFARLCALDVIDQWPGAPDAVVQFLKTGDEALRQEARDATYNVAGWVARYAVWYATGDTAHRAAHCAAHCAADSDDFKAARKKQRKRLLGMIRRARR